MPKIKKSKKKAEFGDFQTPIGLADKVCSLLAREGVRAESIVEPTCGKGNFLLAALQVFPKAKKVIGVEINPSYVQQVKEAFEAKKEPLKPELIQGDFFGMDWPEFLNPLPEPLLVIGNPPWVTNADLGKLQSSNLPSKSNFQKHSGLEARTGKSNFDISEWILIKLFEHLQNRWATLAMLCKTGTARKSLAYAWQRDIGFQKISLYRIDAHESFGASVDACLLVAQLSPQGQSKGCRVFDDLERTSPSKIIGCKNGRLLADISAFQELQRLQGTDSYRWRSGIKHDCKKVMEFIKEGSCFRNGLGELVRLEEEHLFPMLKTSEIANSRTNKPSRWMLVPQKTVSENTDLLCQNSPLTWAYLQNHGKFLDRRASSIYRDRPRFSVFGVGGYSFSPWKIAISGLYKKLKFSKLGSFEGKPIVLDDASYFLPCQSEEEAQRLTSLLNSDVARKFFSAFIFWDSKRPITVDVLEQLNLETLSIELSF